MFWKKGQKATSSSKAKAEVQKPQKVKELSPKEIVTNQIEQLGPGQSFSYRLHETWGGGLVIVELNPEYPEKGQRYILSTDKIVDGKPAGKRSHLWDSDKPKEVAGWIADRRGELVS